MKNDIVIQILAARFVEAIEADGFDRAEDWARAAFIHAGLVPVPDDGRHSTRDAAPDDIGQPSPA
jgi:hypothetical protein